MKKLMIGLMVVAMVAMASMAMAATKTDNLDVTASVAASCSITSVVISPSARMIPRAAQLWTPRETWSSDA